MRKQSTFLVGLAAAGLVLSSASRALAANTSHLKFPSYPAYNKHVAITWWTWTANADKVIQAFNKAYPSITVQHPLVGAGSAEYNKLTTAIKAGTGAPDVVQVEYQYLPKFIDTGGILNIAKYVHQYKPYFQPWTWQQSSRGNKVYAIPEDIGPLALMYRPDVFQKYGLPMPTTWKQFADDAVQLHRANPKLYLSYFSVNDGGWITSLFWQAGARPFEYTPNGWKIDLNSPTAKRVMNYWGSLINQGVIPVANDFTPQWESDLGKGTYATVIGAAWSPTYEIQPYVTNKTKAWEAADIPQWHVSGAFKDGNWGGSTNAVTTQSQQPQAAALFAAWINSSEAGEKLDIADISKGGRGQVPGNTEGEQLPAFFAPNPGLNNQVSGPVFIKAANAVDTSFQWSPWTDFVYNQMTVEFTNAAAGKQSWDQALNNLQREVTVFAKSMGYQITSNSPGSANDSSTSFWRSLDTPALPVVIVIILLAVAVWITKRRNHATVS